MVTRCISLIATAFFAIVLCGCGPSAKQLADQQARQRFRESVAAMKVCTQGSTYSEFRQKRLALETSYTANQSAIADQTNAIDHLVLVMQATDGLWDLKNQIQSQFPYYNEDVSRRHEMAEDMLIIQKGSGLTHGEIKAEGGFPGNYVQHGLTLISSQCDDLLK
jgi:hypothetical protein